MEQNKDKNTTHMKVVTVVPLQKVSFEEELTYFTSLPVNLNDIVSVTLRKRPILGLVIDIVDARDSKMNIKGADFNLRKIEKVLGGAVINLLFTESACDLARYSLLNKNFVLSYLLPETIKENYELIAKTVRQKENSVGIDENNIKSEKLIFQNTLLDRISYYKTLIRESFAAKKSIFIVLPRESDINFFASMLSKGIENFVVTLHGSLPRKKLEESILQAVSSDHAILILATAQYLSIPRKDLRAIILEQESSNSYKSVIEPGLDLRTFVEIFATKTKTKLISSDTLLRFETIGRKDLVHFGELRPTSFRISTETEIKLIEKGVNKAPENKWQAISPESLSDIAHTLQKGKNIFIFTLRKGLATYTICKHCETPVFCPECKAPLVLYTSKDKTKRMFVCNKCRHEKSPDTVCENCGSWNLITLGVGTELVYEELTKHFPAEKIFELNKDIVKSKAGANKVIKEFEKSTGAILLGTEMALFYIKEKVDLSVMVSFDSLWSIPNFKIGEKVLQLILHTLDITEKKLIIETRNISDQAIVSVLNGNLSGYVKEELEDRYKLDYPPYKRFIKIGIKDQSNKALLKQLITTDLASFEPVGYGNNILLRLDNKAWSLPEIYPGGELNTKLSSILNGLVQNDKLHIQVDPEDVL